MKDKVVILMATYNGEKYLSQQLDSIINQTYRNWELWIRDDSSSDDTGHIMANYAAQDKRIHIYHDKLDNLGCVENFATLLQNTTFDDYIMFSDQDDIWLPFKVEMTLQRMKEAEKIFNGPQLVYSKFQLVDNQLKYINIKTFDLPEVIKINHIISQNFIYGCTMMLNKKLVQLVIPISNQAENHDYWIALIAAYHGRITYIEKPTILYRQHDHNVSGNYKNSALNLRMHRFRSGRYAEMLNNRILMMTSLVKHLKNKNKDTEFLEKYIQSINAGGFSAVLFLLSNRLFKHGTGLSSNVMNLLAVFNYKNTKI